MAVWGWPDNEIAPAMDTPPIPYVAGALAVAPRPAERRCRSAFLGRGWEGPPISAYLDRHRGEWRCASPSSPPLRGPSRPAVPCGKAKGEPERARPGLVDTGTVARPIGAIPALIGDAPASDGEAVGERMLRRVEAALGSPSRAGIAGLGATRGGGAGGAQTRPAPNPQQAHGLGGRSQPRPSEPCGPGRPGTARRKAFAHSSFRRPAGAHVRGARVRIGTPCRFRGRIRP